MSAEHGAREGVDGGAAITYHVFARPCPDPFYTCRFREEHPLPCLHEHLLATSASGTTWRATNEKFHLALEHDDVLIELGRLEGLLGGRTDGDDAR